MGHANPQDTVAALLARPESALVAVDFDGTLAPIVARPEDARPVPQTRGVLAALAGRLGGVAVVTGRPATEVVALADLADIRRLRVVGHYGLQDWYDGVVRSPEPAPGIALARARLGGVLEGADAGVRVEDKHHSLAVHTRGAPHPEEELAGLEPALEALADACGLEAVLGRYVIELRPPGIDKGSALRRLIDTIDARVVVYVGDDLGDLPAFNLVAALRDEGAISGITIASVDPADDDAPPEVAQRADMVLDGPAAVVAWLAGLVALLD